MISMAPTFLFATGIENSYPTIQNGRVRVDEMEKCGHYDLWPRDFELVEEMGTPFLRYGPLKRHCIMGNDYYLWRWDNSQAIPLL